ncbi:MAG: hypothetical protein Q8P84_08705 [Deltaproteobacteria bacterium]|nr:hypothetical protein [Deltaproteobacteria bacterium]
MKTKNQNWVANTFIVVATLARLLPHPANMTPVGAVSLVSGSKLNGMYKWVVPFVALALSDALLGIFKNVTPWDSVTFFIYGAFAINIFLGRFIAGQHRYLKLGGLSVFASLQFFLLTNFGVWMQGLLYPKTVAGLAQCYTMALPFLTNTLLGDLVWSLALFTVIERAASWGQKRSLQSAHS